LSVLFDPARIVDMAQQRLDDADDEMQDVVLTRLGNRLDTDEGVALEEASGEIPSAGTGNGGGSGGVSGGGTGIEIISPIGSKSSLGDTGRGGVSGGGGDDGNEEDQPPVFIDKNNAGIANSGGASEDADVELLKKMRQDVPLVPPTG
jgi:hypothetical protein